MQLSKNYVKDHSYHIYNYGQSLGWQKPNNFIRDCYWLECVYFKILKIPRG